MPRYFLSKKAVDDPCLDLTIAPHKGKAYDDILPGIMGVASGSHIIFYRIADAGDIVIVRFLHKRMEARTSFTRK